MEAIEASVKNSASAKRAVLQRYKILLLSAMAHKYEADLFRETYKGFISDADFEASENACAGRFMDGMEKTLKSSSAKNLNPDAAVYRYLKSFERETQTA